MKAVSFAELPKVTSKHKDNFGFNIICIEPIFTNIPNVYMCVNIVLKSSKSILNMTNK